MTSEAGDIQTTQLQITGTFNSLVKSKSLSANSLIEVPFAILLGWETVATIISWNVFVIGRKTLLSIQPDFSQWENLKY